MVLVADHKPETLYSAVVFLVAELKPVRIPGPSTPSRPGPGVFRGLGFRAFDSSWRL